MKTYSVGANITGTGEAFKKFCEKHYSVKIEVEPDSTLLFGTNDHDAVLDMWQAYCKKDLEEVLASLKIKA